MNSTLELLKEIDQALQINDRGLIIMNSNAPKYIHDICFKAHGGMLPDSLRFQMIKDCIENLINVAGDDEDFDDVEIPEPPVYISHLLNWAASNALRLAYANEAIKELGATDIESMLAGGYFLEIQEVMGCLKNEIANHVG